MQLSFRALTVLNTAEFLERFAYYGMRSVLLLFLTRTLNWTFEDAASFYGLLTLVVLIGPALTGLLSDVTRQPVVFAIIGCAMFSAGSFFVATASSDIAVKAGLFIIMAGNAFYKPAIITALFKASMPRKEYFDLIYGIFYFMINLGAFLAPLIVGLVSDTENPEDIRNAFWITGGVMLGVIALLATSFKSLNYNDYAYYNQPFTLSGNAVGTIIVLFVSSLFFWLGYEFVSNIRYQAGDAASVQIFTAIASIVAAMIVVPLSLFLKFRSAYKISGGLFLMVIILFLLPAFGASNGLVMLGLPVAEMLVGPILHSYLIQTGSPRWTGTLVGGLVAVTFLTNKLSGALYSASEESSFGTGIVLAVLMLLVAVGIFLLDHFRPKHPEFHPQPFR